MICSQSIIKAKNINKSQHKNVLTFFIKNLYIKYIVLFYQPRNTMEKINTSSTWKISEKIRNTAIIATIALTLSSCSSKEESYQKQVKEVQQLEYELKQQAENYRYVATQQNIQQDLKEEWADATINQEIWYSLDRAEKQDENIAKTKKKLSEAQAKLARMKEKMQEVDQSERLNSRLKTDKYDYIPEEFKRSRENQ